MQNAKGHKKGCHDINRDFASTKIVSTANIVTSLLKSNQKRRKSRFRGCYLLTGKYNRRLYLSTYLATTTG